MSLLVLGLSHHTAPLALLEAVALDADRRAPPWRRAVRAASTSPRRSCSPRATASRCTPRRAPSTAPSPTIGERARRRQPAWTAGRPARAPLRALRGPRHRARLLGGLRARLDGRRRGARSSARCATRCAPAQTRGHGRRVAERPVPAGAAGRQARPRRDRHRPRSAAPWWRPASTQAERDARPARRAARCSSSAPAA